MTRDEVVALAREAVPGVEEGFCAFSFGDADELERFAALVIAAERARCAEVCRSVARTGLVDGMAAPYHHGANQCAKAIEVSK